MKTLTRVKKRRRRPGIRLDQLLEIGAVEHEQRHVGFRLERRRARRGIEEATSRRRIAGRDVRETCSTLPGHPLRHQHGARSHDEHLVAKSPSRRESALRSARSVSRCSALPGR